jgi:hypothetical protein
VNATIDQPIRTRLLVAGEDTIPVPASLRYDPSDPYAVHVTFLSGDGTCEWVFARDLLEVGLTEDAGRGDVRIWPGHGDGPASVYISLSSPEGEALLEAPADDLRAFMDRTRVAVPLGAESLYLDVDAALAAVLAEGAP